MLALSRTVGRGDAHGKHVTLLLLDRELVEVLEGERQRLALHQAGRNRGRGQWLVITASGKQLRRHILVEHAVVIQKLGSLDERHVQVARQGLSHGHGNVALALARRFEIVALDEDVVNERTPRDKDLVIEMDLALLIALATAEAGGRQEQHG